MNGASIAFTENLEAALRLLYRDDNPEDPYVWVDALCINENDLIERGLHVKRMRDIYEQAFAVFS